jgi:hypothetical protein
MPHTVTISSGDSSVRNTGSTTTATPPATIAARDITAARPPVCVAMKNGRNASRPNAR